MLCENFESLPDGPYPTNRVWRPNSQSRMTVDTTRAARGKKALHITTPATPSETYLSQSKTIAQTGNAFYGRMYFYVDTSPTAFVHWNLVEALGSDNKRAVRYGGIGSGGNRWLFNVETHSIGERAIDNGGPMPFKSWHCMEWFYDGDKNEARLWIDDVENTKEHYRNSFGPTFGFMPPWKSIKVGMVLYQTVNAGYSLWIDEIVIHKDRIGCAM